MFNGLTRQEQRVLFLLVCIITAGLGIQQCRNRAQTSVDIIQTKNQKSASSISIPAPSDKSPSAQPSPSLININTASLNELCTLKGIGPSKASAIIEFRNQHGPYRTVDDLDKVSGIGPATIERIRKEITVGVITPSTTSSVNATTQTLSLSALQTPSPEKTALLAPNRININTAGLKELMSLPGIGEKRAQSIIQYRQQHGGFKSAIEITNIKGISGRNFELIKDKITIADK